MKKMTTEIYPSSGLQTTIRKNAGWASNILPVHDMIHTVPVLYPINYT